jgi:hypothetical protein
MVKDELSELLSDAGLSKMADEIQPENKISIVEPYEQIDGFNFDEPMQNSEDDDMDKNSAMTMLAKMVAKEMDASQGRNPNITINVPPVQFNLTTPEQQPPIVNVNVPEQQAPIVNVNIPEQPAAEITVNVPEQPAANVTVNVPEQQAPIIKVESPVVNVAPPAVTVEAPNVTVNMPKKLNKARLLRDNSGRIEGIESDE